MAILRYVKDANQKQQNKKSATDHTVRSIRAVYETDKEIAKALLPKPLIPASKPEIFVQFSQVAMHLSKERTVKIGAATIGVFCQYKNTKGAYVLAMPMEGEGVVVKGREIFGEPKKIANIHFHMEGDSFHVACERHNITFLEIKGSLEEELPARKFQENFFCYKAQPDILRQGGFDGDVFLTQLDWDRDYSLVRKAKGEITLRDSPYDPLVDVPVKKLVHMEYAEGATKTSGKILEIVPGDWLAPFIHQRYDDKITGGLEVSCSI